MEIPAWAVLYRDTLENTCSHRSKIPFWGRMHRFMILGSFHQFSLSAFHLSFPDKPNRYIFTFTPVIIAVNIGRDFPPGTQIVLSFLL